MAGPLSCPQCGKPAPATAATVRFCGTCGASMVPPPAAAVDPVGSSGAPGPFLAVPTPAPDPFREPPADRMERISKRTMVEYSSPPPAHLPSHAPSPDAAHEPQIFHAPPQQPSLTPSIDPGATVISYAPQPISHVSQPAPDHAPDPHRTMLGMSFGPGAIPSQAPAASAVSTPPEPRREFARTMMGVAIPGIAPPGASAPPQALSVPTPGPSQQASSLASGRPNGQMGQMGQDGQGEPAAQSWQLPNRHVQQGLGRPHVDTSTPLPRSAVEAFRKRRARDAKGPVPPAPLPLIDEPLPAPPKIVRKRGLPIAAVSAAAAIVALGLGGVLLYISHGTPALTAEPRTAGDGAEMLHLSCPTCDDGTTVTLEGQVATMARGEADLALVSPLHPGKNSLDLEMRRPGISRDDAVRLEVPVSFRLAPDLSHLTARPPALGVRIDALPGSKATVDGVAVPLDAAGHGAAAIDIAKDVEGTSDDMKRIERSVPYEVTPPNGATERGSLALRIGIAQLHLDSPNLTPVTASPDILVAGVVAPSAQVAVNDVAVPVGTDGRFAQKVQLVVGSTPIVVAVSQGATVATRMVHLTALRVADLEAEAKARDASTSPRQLDYDSVAADIDSHAGQPIAIAGTLVEARQVGHQMLMLVDDRRGCATPQCLVRVIYGGDGAPTGGRIRAYGKVTRSFRTTSGRIVPEVAADFILPGGRGS